MRYQPKPRLLCFLAAVLAVSLPMSAFAADDDTEQQVFQDLKPSVDIVYLLANSSIILGPDVEGQAEDITFTGPVSVPKFPVKGFNRRQLPSGRYQIDFELTSSVLHGESYLMDGPILLGEHPDLRSLGTITQRRAGTNYPADFIVQRKVLLETPRGVMFNEDPVPVRGTIDSIPPVRRTNRTEQEAELNVFRGRELPIAMLDEEGEIAGWFYSRVHIAFAVHPQTIYRMDTHGEIVIAADGREEVVSVTGPIELVEMVGAPGVVEVVKLALRGESDLLGGPIMVSEVFDYDESASKGNLGERSELDLFIQIRSPSGTLEVPGSMRLTGTSSEGQQYDQVDLAERVVPVLHSSLRHKGTSDQKILDEAGREVGMVKGLTLAADRMAGRRPCCPLPGAEAHEPTETAEIGASGTHD